VGHRRNPGREHPRRPRAAAHLLAALTNTTPDPLGAHRHTTSPFTDSATLRRDLSEHLHDVVAYYAHHAHIFDTEDLRGSPGAERWIVPERRAQLVRLRTALADIAGQSRHAA